MRESEGDLSRSSQNRRQGFSLIEMMWQLVILVVVSFPMVMALNLQKQTIEKDETQARNQVLTTSLFAVVNPNDPDWFHRYTVTSTGPLLPDQNNSRASWRALTGTTRLRRPSIYCDTANPALNAQPETSGNACFINTSSLQASGSNANRGPFFERTLAVVDHKLQVTVKLFESARAAESATAFYESSRDFDLVPVRMLMGQQGATVLEGRQVDEIGNSWFMNTGLNGLPVGSNNWNVLLQNNCSQVANFAPVSGTTSPTYATLQAQPTPYRTFWMLSRGMTSSCDGSTAGTLTAAQQMADDFSKWLVYRIRVAPGTYMINAHFLIPGGVNIGKDCLASTANMSCSLVDVGLTSTPDWSNPQANVSTKLVYDLNAAAGPEFDSGGVLVTTSSSTKPAVFRTEYTVSSNVGEIFLHIKPTKPTASGKTNAIYLTGIEVMRKGQ